MRLDKFLCDMGMGTRSQVKQKIRKGQVTLEGAAVLRPEFKVEPGQQICVDGESILYQEMEYYMLNKPAGCVCARTDRQFATVMELLPARKRTDLSPVGRLDKDTEGLLLITNDGQLSHRLLSPRYHVDKTYYARIQGCVTKDHIKAFEEGLEIGEDRPTLPARLEILEAGECSQVRVTIQEGKYHQIKRMFHTAGCEVLYLKRLSMGSLVLDESLKPGAYRLLTQEEIDALKGRAEET